MSLRRDKVKLLNVLLMVAVAGVVLVGEEYLLNKAVDDAVATAQKLTIEALLKQTAKEEKSES
jgi:hypothetical protein